MNLPASSPQTSLHRLLRLLRPAIWEKRPELLQLLGALILLAASQSLLLVLMGPLFKAAFEDFGTQAKLQLGDLLPGHLREIFPQLAGLEFSRSQVASYLPLGLLAIAFLKSMATYLFQYKQGYLSLHLSMRYREKLFAAIVDQPFSQLQQKSPATWMALVMHDVHFLQIRLSDLFAGFIRDGSVVVASLIALFFVHWPTALVISGLSVPLMLSSGRTGKKIATYAERWQTELGRIAAAVLDLRRRFEFIRAQGGEDLEKKNFRRLSNNYYRMVRKSIFLRSAFAPGLEFVGFCMFAGVIFLIAEGKLGQDFGPGELLQFFAALGIMLRPLKSIGEQLSRYHETMGILSSSLAIFERQEVCSQTIPAKPHVSSSALARLEIKEIVIQYAEGFQFQAENLEILAGKTVALIGPSGAGKSSLLKVLAGLYPPQHWHAEQSWAEIIAESNLVSQQPYVFSGSLRDNLSYGLEAKPSDQAITEALAFVGIDRELNEKGMTLDSELDFILSPLSGGQLQRITVARALLRPRSLLLLDEITAAIDPLAEQFLIERLLQYAKSKGIIMLFVTHRLTQIHLFDQIWFCEAGRLKTFPSSEAAKKDERVLQFLQASLLE